MNISEYLTIPYKDRGRTEDGVDCWGLVRLIYAKELNIELESYVDEYSSSENVKAASKTVKDHTKDFIEVDKPYKRFDIVVFRLSGQPVHVGMLLNDNDFIHSFKGKNVTVEKLSSLRWTNRVVGVFRYAG